MSGQLVLGRGPNFANLANTISDAIFAALERGMEPDEAVSCVVAVAADYGREAYGDNYLKGLAGIVLMQAGKALPASEVPS